VFTLPGTKGVMRINGKVVNGNATGRAGVRFSFVPEEDLDLLESWLATEFAKLERAEMPVGEARAVPEAGELRHQHSAAAIAESQIQTRDETLE
jgi:hypothetical protein